MNPDQDTLFEAAELLSRVAQADGKRADVRVDADETAMLALQLEDMRARVYEMQYPELKARRYLPVSTEVNTGAETFSWQETDEVGEAKVIRNYSDDLPSVEVSGTKQTHSILAIGDSYHYSIQDIRRAAFSGQPLEARKAMAARRAWERKLDSIAAFGDAANGIATGIVNKTPGTSAGNLRFTAATTANWTGTEAADAQGMLDDLNAAVLGFITDSKELWAPTDLLLPTHLHLRLSQTRVSSLTGETVMEAFLKANPYIERVEMWNALNNVGAASNTSRGLLYTRTPEVLELVIPQDFEVMPLQPKNLGFQGLCHGRTAGVAVYRPLGLRYITALPNAA